MFWRVTPFTPLSPIETILDKGDYTLDELLNEDDIIQECKASNSRLVQYLGQQEVLEKLLWYLTETPEDDVHFKYDFNHVRDSISAQHGKYSYTACEILCCEIDDVMSALTSSNDLMQCLFSPLKNPPPLNPTLAGYFGRVVGSLLVKRAVDTHKWLASHLEIVPALVKHVDTTSTVEVILRLISGEDAGGNSSPSDWLSNTSLMDQFLNTLIAPKERNSRAARIQRAAQQNVGDILVHVARHQITPMIKHLTAPSYLNQMLEAAVTEGSCVLQPVVKVAIALLTPRNTSSPSTPPSLSIGLMGPYDQPLDSNRDSVRIAANEIVKFIPNFAAVLNQPSPLMPQSQNLPYGTVTPPLGRHRIAVIELGQALLATFESSVLRAMLNSEFVARSMDLFQHYPFNNILHSYVLDMLGTLIEALSPDRSDSNAAWRNNCSSPATLEPGQVMASSGGEPGAGIISGYAPGSVEPCDQRNSVSENHCSDPSIRGSASGSTSPITSPSNGWARSNRIVVQPDMFGSPAEMAEDQAGPAEVSGSSDPGLLLASQDTVDDLEEQDDEFIIEWLDNINIVGWIIKLNSQPESAYTVYQPNANSRTKPPIRASYHGHITQLAAKLQDSKHGLLQATLDMNRDWQSFTTTYLDRQLVLEDRSSWKVDLPAEPAPDDMVEIPGCSNDVYSGGEFDHAELLGFGSVPMAGRYAVEDDDDDYADSNLSMFQQEGGALDRISDGYDHLIEEDGEFYSRSGGCDVLATMSGQSEVVDGGVNTCGNSCVSGHAAEQMQALSLVDVATVDEDDEVVMGSVDVDNAVGTRENPDTDKECCGTAHDEFAAEIVDEEASNSCDGVESIMQEGVAPGWRGGGALEQGKQVGVCESSHGSGLGGISKVVDVPVPLDDVPVVGTVHGIAGEAS